TRAIPPEDPTDRLRGEGVTFRGGDGANRPRSPARPPPRGPRARCTNTRRRSGGRRGDHHRAGLSGRSPCKRRGETTMMTALATVVLVAVSLWGSHPASGEVRSAPVRATAANGPQRVWGAIFDSGGFDQPSDMAVSPDGRLVFVGGRSVYNQDDFQTLAYRASAGDLAWQRVYDGGNNDQLRAMAVSPDGARLFVT